MQDDYVSQLNLWIQAQPRQIQQPVYATGNQKGPSHAPIWGLASVAVDNTKFVTKGEFKSKKEARQAAARKALESLTSREQKQQVLNKALLDDEEEIDEFLVLSNFQKTCAVIDFDNVHLTSGNLESMIRRCQEVHLFYSGSKNVEPMTNKPTVHYHRTQKLSPQMSDHFISWWVCNNYERLAKENVCLEVISSSVGVKAVVQLARFKNVQTKFYYDIQ